MSEFRSLDEMLQLTRGRAAEISRRRRLQLSAIPIVVAVALVSGLVVIAQSKGSEGTRVATTVTPTSITTTLAPGTLDPRSLTASPTTVPPASVPTDSTTVVSPPSSTTSTTLACVNSTDKRCGPFRWEPEPNDQPTQITVRVDPAVPRVGEDFFLVVTITDPDRPLLVGEYSPVKFAPFITSHTIFNPGWGPRERVPRTCAAGYGAWTPPPSGPPGHHELVFGPFRKSEPGTYQFAGSYMPVVGVGATNAERLPGQSPPPFGLQDGELPQCVDPYAGPRWQPIQGAVTVAPRDEPTTTTTTGSTTTTTGSTTTTTA